MINNCSVSDKDKIIELGKLINKKFDKLNDIDKLIENNNIIGYYDNKSLVGMLVFNINYEILDLLYIVVNPIYRNKLVASNLMKYLINNYEFEKILLEVRCDNVNAIKLYKKYNFKIINIRKNYYDHMDAYVMEVIK